MWKQHFASSAGSGVLDLPLFALVLFMAVFAGVVAWVFLVRRPAHFEGVSRLPLETTRGDEHV